MRSDPWNLPIHPAAELFPMMSETDLQSLAVNIKANGQLQSILLIEEDGAEKVLDGRNRLAACTMAGVEPSFTLYGGHDPYALVVSANLHRRHLSQSQRSMVAESLAKMKSGTRTDLAQHCARSDSSQDEAAKMLQVSRRNVQKARRVVEQGIPELAAAVVAGKMSVNAANQAVKLPPEEQRRLVTEGPKAVKQVRLAPAEEGETSSKSRFDYNREATAVGRAVRDWAIRCRKRRYPMSQVIDTIEEMIEGLRQHTGGNDE